MLIWPNAAVVARASTDAVTAIAVMVGVVVGAAADVVRAVRAADAQGVEDVAAVGAMVVVDRYKFPYEQMDWNANLHATRTVNFHASPF